MTAPGCLLQTGAVFCEKIVDAFGSRKEYTYDIRLRISPEYKRKESKEDINLSETAGKRIAAFIIDYMILCWVACLTGVLGVFVVASRGVQELAENFQWMIPGMFLYCVLLMGIWFFILDIFGNLDPGKRLVKIELLSNGQKFTVSTAIKHSVLKTLFCCIWPISFLYYIVKQEMIYDRILKISVSSRP